MAEIEGLKFADEELKDNPRPQLAVCLCLDVSGSMAGEPIRELEEGVRRFFDELEKDALARASVEVALVTFGGEARPVFDFQRAETARDAMPPLQASGSTPLGQAVQLSLRLLQDRKAFYKAVGTQYYQPWLVLMTDGYPTDVGWQQAARECAAMVSGRTLTVMPVLVGPEADATALDQFSPAFSPAKLRGLAFDEFFIWLSESVVAVSNSIPGQNVPLPRRGWDEAIV